MKFRGRLKVKSGSFLFYISSVANGEPPIGIPWETFQKYAKIASPLMKGVVFMEYIYIVFYSRENQYDPDDYITDCISKIFKTEEKAIKYCESLGKKNEKYNWYESYQEEYDWMDELVEYRYRYIIRQYSITE